MYLYRQNNKHKIIEIIVEKYFHFSPSLLADQQHFFWLVSCIFVFCCVATLTPTQTSSACCCYILYILSNNAALSVVFLCDV